MVRVSVSVPLALLVRMKAAVRIVPALARRGPRAAAVDRARASGWGRTEGAGQAECQRGARGGTGNAEAREACEPPPLVRAAPAGDRRQRWPLGHGQFRQGIAQFRVRALSSRVSRRGSSLDLRGRGGGEFAAKGCHGP